MEIYVPDGLKFQQPVFFVADNIDCDEDTPDGKSTFQVTIAVVFQSHSYTNAGQITNLPLNIQHST